MRAVAVSRPDEIPGLAEGYDVVGIDEVQFFPEEVVLVVERARRARLARRRGRPRPGLPRPPVGSLPELLCRAELVDKLAGRLPPLRRPRDHDATPDRRTRPLPADDATIVVGALDSYEARCRSCHQLAEPARATG